MANKNTKKDVLSIEDILKRKDFFKNKNNETKEVYIKRLDSNIVISKADDLLCADIADMDDNLESNKYFVYEIVKEPNLKDPKLHEEFEIKNPLDIVTALFDPGEINGIATEGMKLAGFYGGVELVDDLKN